MNPIDNPEAYNTVRIGSVTSLLCDLSEWPRKYEYDVKKGKGTVGSTTTFVANPPAEGKITFFLWLPEHWTQWDAFVPLLQFDPTKTKAQAFDIYHPALARLKINSVQTTSIGLEKNQAKDQLWSIECSFIEYRPTPKKDATSTATGSKSIGKGGIPGALPDPIGDAQQARIAALLKQASQP